MAPGCSICQEGFDGENPIECIAECGHVYHTHCLQQWLETSRSGKQCPLCRTSCEQDDAVISIFLTQISSGPEGTDGGEQTGEFGDAGKENLLAQARLFQEKQRLELSVAAAKECVKVKEREKELVQKQVSALTEKLRQEQIQRVELTRKHSMTQTLTDHLSSQLKDSTAQIADLEQKVKDMEAKSALVELQTNIELDKEALARLCQTLENADSDPHSVIDSLQRTVLEKNKQFKELMGRCQQMGFQESQANSQLSEANRRIRKLKEKLVEAEAAIAAAKAARRTSGGPAQHRAREGGSNGGERKGTHPTKLDGRKGGAASGNLRGESLGASEDWRTEAPSRTGNVGSIPEKRPREVTTESSGGRRTQEKPEDGPSQAASSGPVEGWKPTKPFNNSLPQKVAIKFGTNPGDVVIDLEDDEPLDAWASDGSQPCSVHPGQANKRVRAEQQQQPTGSPQDYYQGDTRITGTQSPTSMHEPLSYSESLPERRENATSLQLDPGLGMFGFLGGASLRPPPPNLVGSNGLEMGTVSCVRVERRSALHLAVEKAKKAAEKQLRKNEAAWAGTSMAGPSLASPRLTSPSLASPRLDRLGMAPKEWVENVRKEAAASLGADVEWQNDSSPDPPSKQLEEGVRKLPRVPLPGVEPGGGAPASGAVLNPFKSQGEQRNSLHTILAEASLQQEAKVSSAPGSSNKQASSSRPANKKGTGKISSFFQKKQS